MYNEGNVFLFEFGSTSLKLHFRFAGDAQAREVKTPWRIGHEIFATGRISGQSTADAISTVRMSLAWLAQQGDSRKALGIATGAFRLAPNCPEFLQAVADKTGVAVRLISGVEEAMLLSHSFQARCVHYPAFAFDLGGGSLQWTSVDGPGRVRLGSIPLGAIQLLRSASNGHGFEPTCAERLVEEALARLPKLKAARAVGTGGTVSALRRVFGGDVFGRDALDALEDTVRNGGIPSVLMPHRREIFLPGLMVVTRLLRTLGASELCHERLSLGAGMLEMLYPSNGIAPAPGVASGRMSQRPSSASA